jgi:hypothetical protein
MVDAVAAKLKSGNHTKAGLQMKKFATQIYDAVKAGKLAEPFDAAMVRRACPGWSEKSYGVFLSKHADGNGANTELFARVRPGYYRLNNSN